MLNNGNSTVPESSTTVELLWITESCWLDSTCQDLRLLNIGKSRTLGAPAGEKRDTSDSLPETPAVSAMLLHSPLFE